MSILHNKILLKAHLEVAEGLEKMLRDTHHISADREHVDTNSLLSLLEQIKDRKVLNTDKLSRWIGYIQCGLCELRITDVTTERNRTRPIYVKAYREIER